MSSPMEYLSRLKIFNNVGLLDENIYLSYKGPIDAHILNVLGDYIRKIIGRNPKVSKKLFSVFIELAQNISYYSAESERLIESRASGIGAILIAEMDTKIAFVTGNKVNKADVMSLLEKCEHINSLNKEKLREFKREEINRPFGANDSAHIGLIQVALTADYPLEVEVSAINDDTTFFAISVTIDKFK